MTKETISMIHRSYQEAVEKSTDIMGIVTALHDDLSSKEIPEEDTLQFDSFLDGLVSCINTRYKTFEMTNLATDVIFILMYIIIWLNNSQDMGIDINLSARRKSLESDLQKLLHKAVSNSSTLISDRFGLRGIILNIDSSRESTEMLITVSNYFIGILANKNRKARSTFLEWIEENRNIDDFTKIRIKNIIDLPFKVDSCKDYVTVPKPNGYQSLHYILVLDVDSPRLPGAKLELQMRNNFMHKVATKGSAGHNGYKEDDMPEEIKNVFTLDSFDNVNIIGFTGYDSIDDDMDGIHLSKLFYNRRISSTLVR